jgi:hypothetical protein
MPVSLSSSIVLFCEGEVKKTVYLVGKGITYDTGGADIKAGGHMAGMSRYRGTSCSRNSQHCLSGDELLFYFSDVLTSDLFGNQTNESIW